jgi:hypothetical protein
MGTYTNLVTNDTRPPVKPQKPAAVPSLVKEPGVVKPDVARNDAPVRASKHVRKQPTKRASVYRTMQVYIEQCLEEKATQGFTFRYPPQLLEELEDVIYEVRKQHRHKLAKNAIAVLALAYVIKDYLDNGEDSVFYRMLLAK